MRHQFDRCLIQLVKYWTVAVSMLSSWLYPSKYRLVLRLSLSISHYSMILKHCRSLGYLNCIRIWHDNQGQGSWASWYLKYIIVQDLQTMEKFHFIAQQWFAVEKSDGQVCAFDDWCLSATWRQYCMTFYIIFYASSHSQIERILPVAGQIEKQKFSYVLSKKAYHNISDGHLWFSIFSRPLSTRFTRVQRCTCCFVLLFMSMLLNIMYYDVMQEAKSSNQIQSTGLSIGPLYISGQQVGFLSSHIDWKRILILWIESINLF